MKSSILFLLALPTPLLSFSFNAYNLGLYGVYPQPGHHTLDEPAPWVQSTILDDRCANSDEYIFITPRGVNVPNPGPVILDSRGELVWIESKYGQAMNLQVQSYKGKDYLTFWSGTSHGASSNGTYYMLDETYELAHQVTALALPGGDLHEFAITSDGTALMTVYQTILTNCTYFGTPTCYIHDCLFQEIDIETNTLLFEWRASTHIPLSQSYKSPPSNLEDESNPWDFFHLNSIQKTSEGNYLISARHTHTIYLISPKGSIIWSLGGKSNSFTDLTPPPNSGQATNFLWQHHARLHSNGTILTLFDNHANIVFHSPSTTSRGLKLEINQENLTTSLIQEYVHPSSIAAISQGNMQLLPSGNAIVGWGNTPALTEFSPTGEVLCDFYFGAMIFSQPIDFGWVKSYRSFKFPWVGKPKREPVVKGGRGEGWVSWNGATEVRGWRVEREDEDGDDNWIVLANLEKSGFETRFVVDVPGLPIDVRVLALDKDGKVIGESDLVEILEARKFSILQISIGAIGFTIAAILMIGYWRMLFGYLASGAILISTFIPSFKSRFGKIDQRYELLEAVAEEGESFIPDSNDEREQSNGKPRRSEGSGKGRLLDDEMEDGDGDGDGEKY